MNITVIVLVTIVLILLYGLFVMYYFGKKSTLISSKLYLKQDTKTIQLTTDQYPAYKTFSYSLWVYMNQDITSLFNIMYFTKDSATTVTYTNDTLGGTGVFGLYLKDNNLYLCTGDSSNNIMTPFTKQRWVNIFINSFENEYYEVYINGKLIKTIKSDANIPAPTTNSFISLGDSTKKDVVITKLVRFTKTLDSYSVWNNYLEGNGMSYNKYNASLEVKEDKDTLYRYKLFT